MRRLRGRLSGAVVVLVGLVAFTETSCRSVPVRRGVEAPTAPEQLYARWVAAPSIRVGIAISVARASISADSGVALVGLGRDGGSPAERVQRATVLGRTGAEPTPWRVQIASLADGEAARGLAARIEAAMRWPVSLVWNEAAQTHQVRVGQWSERERARAAADELARRGFQGGWVVAQPTLGDDAGIRVLETGQAYPAALVTPAVPGETLTVDGVPYRGVIEVRGGGGETVTVVNVVQIEDYLRGVVPNELSPQAFPQIEALKAQAVAARTYALRNLGQFAAKGFDLCATPSCQVYRGKSSEQPLTDRAVEETRGVVATHRGELINAFYTSTCGGHTEDGENIFAGKPAPYLRGVVCSAERSQWRVIRGGGPVGASAADGVAARDVALLVALGVINADDGVQRGAPSHKELESWVGWLLAALSRSGCEVREAESVTRRGAFFAYLTSRLCWDERSRRFLREGDLSYLLQVDDRAQFANDAERVASALLIQEEILSADGENRLRPQALLTRAEALAMLAQAARRVGGPGLVSMEFVDATGNQLIVRDGELERTMLLEATTRLVRSVDGASAAASELLVIPGERLSLVEKDGRVLYLEAMQSRSGAAADRASRYYRWEVRLTPAEVARGVAKLGDVGVVRDMVPRRHGVSGRVVELAVVGSKGEIVLRGLDIRGALGLRENLFVIEREVGPDGAVRRFVIAGRGWGHGVGLCQVGASGLARAGATYDAILSHYYTGIALETRR